MKIRMENMSKFNSEALRWVSYSIAALLLTIAHVVLIDLVAIGGMTPDLLLILTVWIVIHEGRFKGLFAGFAIGLLLDLLSTDVIGTNALTKTVAAFIAGAFYREGKADQIAGSLKFLMIVLISSIAHNLIYYFFYLRVTEINLWEFFAKYGIATSLYTTIAAVFPMLTKIPRKGL
ncbi:MAG: rod shape-determining protein MreD [Candidatus Kapaibacterium sp.]